MKTYFARLYEPRLEIIGQRFTGGHGLRIVLEPVTYGRFLFAEPNGPLIQGCVFEATTKTDEAAITIERF